MGKPHIHILTNRFKNTLQIKTINTPLDSYVKNNNVFYRIDILSLCHRNYDFRALSFYKIILISFDINLIH
jgi:hypothetical protein